MKKQILIFFLVLFTLCSYGQGKTPYKIYTSKGKEISYKKVVKKLKKADVLLFGEYHNNAIAHWLQLEVTKDLYQTNKLILGAEMIEADNQLALNQYLNGSIDNEKLKEMARLWSNYKTDYAPLVDFAKRKELDFIATNIPRIYARKVNREGGFEALDSLPKEAKQWIAPLPILFDINLPQYQNMLEMMGGIEATSLVKAQAIKDATMAHFILKNYKANHTFIHFNGAFHSDFYEGILWYLKQENNNLNYMTISTVEQKDIHQLDKEHKGRADFIICVDEDMTKTY